VKVCPNDEERKRWINGLVRNEHWKIWELYLKEEYLPELYRLACARPDTVGREWCAGRAAMVQELLDYVAELREGRHG
jgi:hypothetical protein